MRGVALSRFAEYARLIGRALGNDFAQCAPKTDSSLLRLPANVNVIAVICCRKRVARCVAVGVKAVDKFGGAQWCGQARELYDELSAVAVS